MTTVGSLRVMRDWLTASGVTNRSDGVDVDVLEGAVLLPGGDDGGLAAQRRAHEGGAGPQDRRPGRRVDRPAARARAAAPGLLPPPEIRHLRMLTRNRVQLVGDRTRDVS